MIFWSKRWKSGKCCAEPYCVATCEKRKKLEIDVLQPSLTFALPPSVCKEFLGLFVFSLPKSAIKLEVLKTHWVHPIVRVPQEEEMILITECSNIGWIVVRNQEDLKIDMGKPRSLFSFYCDRDQKNELVKQECFDYYKLRLFFPCASTPDGFSAWEGRARSDGRGRNRRLAYVRLRKQRAATVTSGFGNRRLPTSIIPEFQFNSKFRNFFEFWLRSKKSNLEFPSLCWILSDQSLLPPRKKKLDWADVDKWKENSSSTSLGRSQNSKKAEFGVELKYTCSWQKNKQVKAAMNVTHQITSLTSSPSPIFSLCARTQNFSVALTRHWFEGDAGGLIYEHYRSKLKLFLVYWKSWRTVVWEAPQIPQKWPAKKKKKSQCKDQSSKIMLCMWGVDRC